MGLRYVLATEAKLHTEILTIVEGVFGTLEIDVPQFEIIGW